MYRGERRTQSWGPWPPCGGHRRPQEMHGRIRWTRAYKPAARGCSATPTRGGRPQLWPLFGCFFRPLPALGTRLKGIGVCGTKSGRWCDKISVIYIDGFLTIKSILLYMWFQFADAGVPPFEPLWCRGTCGHALLRMTGHCLATTLVSRKRIWLINLSLKHVLHWYLLLGTRGGTHSQDLGTQHDAPGHAN